MLTYARLRNERREFLALTGLTVPEFELLLTGFGRAYERRYPSDRTMAGSPRHRQAGGGRKPILAGPEQRLLFILVYLKTYPLQVLMGELFGLSRTAANRGVHRLLPALRDALDDLGIRPERDPGRFADQPVPAAREPRRTTRAGGGTDAPGEKKAAGGTTDGRGEAGEPAAGPLPGPGRARHLRREALAHREGRTAEHQRRGLRFSHGSRVLAT